MLVIDDVPTNCESARWLLEAGRRSEAAYYLQWIAEKGTSEEVREALKIAARELSDVGDKRQGRGRPPRPTGPTLDNPNPGRRGAREGRARLALLKAVVARHLVDSDPVGPQTLAQIMTWNEKKFAEEPEGLIDDQLREWREAAMRSEPETLQMVRKEFASWAVNEIRSLGLGTVPRQGFRAVYRREIAKAYRVSEEALKGAAPKVED